MGLSETLTKLSLTEKLMELRKTYQAIALDNSLVYEDAQSLIPILDIQDDLIFTETGQILSMVEIIPVNFKNLSDEEQNIHTDAFGAAFKQLPENGHFKMMNVNTNLDNYEKRIREACIDEENERIDERIENYIAFMRKKLSFKGTTKRFFYIFEYEGNERRIKSDLYKDIYQEMKQTKKDVTMALRSMGNIVLELNNDIYSMAEVFYQFYNPRSSLEETLDKRIKKVSETASWFGQAPTLRDCIAPRGIKYGKWNYLVMDGVYHSYFAITDEGYPDYVNANWLSNVYNQLSDCDMDIYYKKNETIISEKLVERTEVIYEAMSLRYDSYEAEKKEELDEKASTATFIREARKNGEDMYEVCVIFTMRSPTYEKMVSDIQSFNKAMKRTGIELVNCFLRTDKFFQMSMPLMNINSGIFASNKRNITNSGLSSFYSFISSIKFDEEGVWIGITNDGSPFAIDLFSKKYVNPHVLIAGTTGAGKSFTSLGLTSRMRMTGARTMYVLPLKGEDYKDAIESMGGEFISLYPGSQSCINVCEIRAQEKILSEEESASCLLADKVSSLIAWFSLLMDKNDYLTTAEVGLLNVLFTKVYEEKGITEDNNSIYIGGNPQNGLKKMPIIEDLQNAIKKEERLKRLNGVLEPWVNGNCSRMNGETNVSFKNKTIAFNVDQDKTTEALLPAFMYIAFDECYQIAKSDKSERCAITLDETWMFLGVPACANQILKMIKILRSYKTSCIIATQNIGDFDTDVGRRILNLPATKIIMKFEKTEMNDVLRVIDLSQVEQAELMNFSSGDALYSYNNEKVRVHIALSELEMMYYEAEPEEKARKRELISRYGLL